MPSFPRSVPIRSRFRNPFSCPIFPLAPARPRAAPDPVPVLLNRETP